MNDPAGLARPPLPFWTRTTILLLGALVVLVGLAYSNHFQNEFHFDDMHTVVDNPYIRDLRFLPRFFTDSTTFSIIPENRSWRPLVTTSLAIDYWLGGGLKPIYFHLSTFVWFLIQVILIYALMLRICNLARPDSDNRWVAWFTAALYGVHPAEADTVNYVIQRGDLYSTLGVVAGLAIYAYAPGLRKRGIYLLPVVAGLLCKPPALVFPAILFLYILYFEEVDFRRAAIHCIPALLVTGAVTALSTFMIPATYNGGALSPANYRITQPLVALRYFRTFFLPTDLSADTDHKSLTGLFDGGAWLGFVFVGTVIALALWCSRKREWRPVAFGLFWYLLAMVTTSLIPLGDIENSHRMFFPFVGLAIAVSWTAASFLNGRRVPRFAMAAAGGLLLAALAWGTWQRNTVWRTSESFWYDVTVKSPRNPRGLMNFGSTQAAKRNFYRALDYYEQALVYTPNSALLELNLAVVNSDLHRDAEVEPHLKRALHFAADDFRVYYIYGRWLLFTGHLTGAIQMLNSAVELNPVYLDAWHLLLTCYIDASDADNVRRTALTVLASFPTDAEARDRLKVADTIKPTPELYVSRAATAIRLGKYDESIQAARAALALRPNYAEAWNNIGVAEGGLGHWEAAIQAEEQAVRLKPDFELAKNNLANLRLKKPGTDSIAQGANLAQDQGFRIDLR